MRVSMLPGITSIFSPTCKLPLINVPVTTVPNPETVNTLSIGNRAAPKLSLAATSSVIRSISRVKASNPIPLTAETGMIRASAKNVCESCSRISSCIKSNHSESTKSALVKAIIPFLTCNKETIFKCSRVCGMIPSSAAMTKMTTSRPPTPANIFLINRS